MQKTKIVKMLPKTTREILNGGLYRQSVRCGKKNCKCALGETHSAHYFFTRTNGKLLKFYIRKSQVESFSSLVYLATLERTAQRTTSRQTTEILKELRQSLRDYQSYINALQRG